MSIDGAESNGFPRRNGDARGRDRRPGFVSVDKLFDKVQPSSPEAEMSLLGSMILDPRVTGDVIPFVTSGEAFYDERHGAIFDALVTLYDKHQTGDLVQLAQTLKDRAVLDDIGGPDYLVRLAEQVPSAVNAPHYARIVAEKFRLRRLIDAASKILYDAFHAGELGPDGAREVLDDAEQMIFKIAEQSEQNDAQRLSELLHQTMELLEANEGRSVSGLPTGFTDLDRMTTGLQRGEMIIVAARPSMGKTALALNLAEQIALGGVSGPYGRPTGAAAPVGVFSLEMSRQSVAQRLMCARSGVDSHLVRTNMLSEEHFAKLIRACGELGDAPIFIDDTPALTILALRARARRMVAKHGVQCIIIDYLQLMTAPGSARESRQVEVSAISRGVKALARELNVPVICLAQLNRGAEQREGHRPRMSDLRESGSIEQDADVIMLLHREEYYHQSDPEWLEMDEDKAGLAELIIAKQRNGPTGTVNLTWDARTTRFYNHAGRSREFGAPLDAYEPKTPKSEAPFDPAPGAPPFDAPPAPPAPRGFAPGSRSGPVGEFRDGGGPDKWDDEDIDDLPV